MITFTLLKNPENKMRIFRLVFAFFLVLGSQITALAQTAIIRGKVTESGKGEPVLYTTVFLKGTKFGVQTDIEGFYSITKVPPGSYLIIVKTLEYDSTAIPITVKANEIALKNIVLQKKAHELIGVTIDAESTRSTEEVRISVTTITPKDIKLVPSIGEPDIAQYMQNLPGVITTGDAGGQLYIRGGAPVQNEVLLDGMLIYNPFHSIGLFSVFDNDIIKNADIYTGGFNAQYGGRISAVMDITTKDGNKKKLSGKVSASTFGGKVLLEGPLKKAVDENSGSISFVTSVKSSYLQQSSKILYPYAGDNGLDANGKPLPRGLPFDYTDLYGKVSFNAGSGSKLNIFGFDFSDHVNDYRGLHLLNWGSAGFGSNFVVVPQSSQTIVTGHFAYSKYKINMQQNSYDSTQTSSISGFNFGLGFTYYNGKNQLDYGVDLIGSSTDFHFHNEIGHLIDATANTTEISLFMKYRMLLFNDKFVIEPGFRFQYYATLNVPSPEPRLGMKLNVTKRFRLKASGGLYTQDLVSAVPEKDVVNLFYGFLSAPTDIPTSYTDEKGVSHEVTNSLQKAWHAIFGFEYDVMKNLSLNVEGYLKDFTQLTNLNRDKLFEDDAAHANYPDAQKKDFIIETGKAYGVDFETKYKYKHLYFWAVYSLGYVTRWDGTESYRPHFDRRHNINLVSSYNFGKNDDRTWEIDARFNFGSGFPFTPTQGFYQNQTLGSGINSNYTSQQGSLGTLYGAYNSAQLPAYMRLDINLKKTIEFKEHYMLEVTAGASNVTNQQNIFYVDRITSQKVYQLPIMPTVSMGLTF
jgi:hypothetical protein